MPKHMAWLASPISAPRPFFAPPLLLQKLASASTNANREVCAEKSTALVMAVEQLVSFSMAPPGTLPPTDGVSRCRVCINAIAQCACYAVSAMLCLLCCACYAACWSIVLCWACEPRRTPLRDKAKDWYIYAEHAHMIQMCERETVRREAIRRETIRRETMLCQTLYTKVWVSSDVHLVDVLT